MAHRRALSAVTETNATSSANRTGFRGALVSRCAAQGPSYMLLDFTIALLNTALGEVVHIPGIVLQLTRSNGYGGLFGSPEPTLVGLCGALRIRPAEGALFDHDSAGIQIFYVSSESLWRAISPRPAWS